MQLRSSAALRVLVELLCRTLPSIVVGDSSQAEEEYRKRSTRFMALYIFDLCFAEGSRVGDTGLLADLVYLVAEQPLPGLEAAQAVADEAGGGGAYRFVLPSEAGRVTLLNNVLEQSSEAARPAVQQLIDQQLQASLAAAEAAGLGADTPLAMSYVAVLEQRLEADPDFDPAARPPPGLAMALLTPGHAGGRPALEVLASMASARVLIKSYAVQIAACVEPRDGQPPSAASLERMAALKAGCDTILGPEAGGADLGALRSGRLFLLKVLERCRGVSFVRAAMQQPPLAGSSWLQAWLEQKEAGMLRFQGANKLPAANPLAAEAAALTAGQAVAAALSSGSLAPLELLIEQHAAEPKKLLPGLAAGLFHEVALLRVLPSAIDAVVQAKIDALQVWLTTGPSLDCLGITTCQRRLLALCAGTLQPEGGDAAVRSSLESCTS